MYDLGNIQLDSYFYPLTIYSLEDEKNIFFVYLLYIACYLAIVGTLWERCDNDFSASKNCSKSDLLWEQK